MNWLKNLFDYLGGALDVPPPGLRLPLSAYWWGIWWGVLICVIMIFCGQSSKFIYIDF